MAQTDRQTDGQQDDPKTLENSFYGYLVVL